MFVRVVVHVPRGPYSGTPEHELDNPEHWHRFHIHWCATVSQWKKNLRKTIRDDGLFTYPVFNRYGAEFRSELRDGGRKLRLCSNCLEQVPRTQQFGALLNFDLARFLKATFLSNSPDFQTIEYVYDFDQTPNRYESGWSQISKGLKDLRNWRCEQCFIDLSAPQHRRFLHAHHRDRNPGNNAIFNLMALCIRCHAREHGDNPRFNNQPAMIAFNEQFPAR